MPETLSYILVGAVIGFPVGVIFDRLILQPVASKLVQHGWR